MQSPGTLHYCNSGFYLSSSFINMGRAPCCDKANVKKGPWSPEEDAKLKSFIEQNGTGGNWITLPSKAGLKRCGKSCRLRWINYLRPDIKHGSFTEEEEKTIYRLHAQIGSRWSLIAAQLPGRTDNDIKNYWNTRLKKKLVERGNGSHYGRPHPYQIPAHLFNQIGLQDQMASAAAREGLLHGQQSYNMNQQSYYQLYQQQQQYLLQQQQQHQVIQDPNQTVHLPTVMQHQMNLRSIKNEMVDEHQQQQTVVAPMNGAGDEAERQRLMAIESSLRSIIVTDEAASGSGSGGSRRIPISNMGAIQAMQARLSNSMSPGAVTTHHNTASPASSCSNLSPDRNSFGIQIADSAFTDSVYNAYDDQANRHTTATMLNTSILGPSPQVINLQNPAAAPSSMLATARFDDNVLFGEDLAVYNRSQGLSDIAVVDRVKEESQGGVAGASGDWWTSMDIVSPPRNNLNPNSNGSSSRAATILSPSMKWPIATPRCGAENIYTSPQAQLASQAHGTQPLDSMTSYTDSYFSKLII